MPRLEPLEAPFPPQVDEVLRGMMPPGAAPITLFRTLARNLPMTLAMNTWGGYELSNRLSVGIREREIIIDRTCARCLCEYEWGVHIAHFASRAKLSEAQISSLTHGQHGDSCWTSHRDRILIRLADALHDAGDVSDDLWEMLVTEFDDRQILDLVALCGWYHAISFIARTARVPLEPGAPRFEDLPRTDAEHA